MKIGIPRALLYYFYEDLWINFFKNINIETVLSPETNKSIIKKGIANSIDEGCYSSKIFIGHVEYLINKCDMIFVPRIENSGIREEYCTRIFGIYDLVRNTFPEVKLLHANINYLFRKREPEFFMEIGAALGKGDKETAQAYDDAMQAANLAKKEKIEKQEDILNNEGLKVLMVSHAYNTFDMSIGKPVIDFFEENHIKIAYADLIEEKEGQRKAKETYGSRIYWKVSAELMGGIEAYKDRVDGIVLLSTFPCGPDSIFNELIIRIIKDKPILSLMIDEQDASAGLLTRLESFTDIITAQKKGVKQWQVTRK